MKTYKISRRNLLLGVGSFFAYNSFLPPAFADSPSAVCARVGQKILYKGRNYICVKSGSKLKWQSLTPLKPPVVVHTDQPQPTQPTQASTAPTPSPSATSPSPTPTPSTTTQVTGFMVGTIVSLSDGAPKILSGKNSQGRSENFVVALSNGKLTAHSVVCTHAGCAVAAVGSGSSNVACPCHGAVFDGVTGSVINGPARSPLLEYIVAQVGNEIYILKD
jgi:Rieske Fe-S protein